MGITVSNMNRRRVEAQGVKPIKAASISIPTTSIVVPVTDVPVRRALISGGLVAFREGRR